MSFGFAGVLWLLLPLGLLALWRFKRGEQTHGRDAVLLFSGMVLLVIALARPYTPARMVEEEAYGMDVVLAVDVSHSMSAADILPSRFEHAKKMVRELVALPGANRYTVIAFTSSALPLSPLTSDREILSGLLDSLEMENILTKSTDIMAVLKTSAKILKGKTKPVVIFSDGGDKREFSAEIAFAKKEGLVLFFVPVATTSGAKLYDRFGEIILDSAKRLVISYQNRHLAALTGATGGLYMEDFDAKALLEKLEASEAEQTSQSMATLGQKPLFLPFVLGAFVLFMLTTIRLRKRAALLLLLLLPQAPTSLHAGVWAFWYEHRAQSSYRTGDFETAAEYYERLAGENHSYNVAFNLANSYYQLGRFDEAIILYEAIKSGDPVFKSDIYYNLGNAYAKKEEFKKADERYLKSLLLGYSPSADRNRQVVKRAKKGYDPDSLKKKGAGKKDKGTPPKKEGSKEGKEPPKETSAASKKVNLSEKEKQVIKKAQKQKSLSYKQYQMINERAGSSEKNPW